MTKRISPKLLALLLTWIMLLGLMPAVAGAVEPPINVKVSFLQDVTGFDFARQSLLVAPDLSETNGFADAYDGEQVTVLDALVAMHIAVDGDVTNLDVNSGAVTKLMGVTTINSTFFVNGELPGEGNLNVTQAVLNDGDIIEAFIYQDSWFQDVYAWFEQDGHRLEQITVAPNVPFELTLRGYGALYAAFGYDLSYYTEPFEDAGIVSLYQQGLGAYIDDFFDYTDGDGKITLEFDTVGTYILSAIDDSGGDTPLMAPWLTVHVTSGGVAPAIDKSALDSIISVVPTSQGNYTDASWGILQTKLAAANAVANDDDATQLEVQYATSALKNAIRSLVWESIPPQPVAWRPALDSALSWLWDDAQNPGLGNEWAVISLARAGIASDEAQAWYQKYLDDLLTKTAPGAVKLGSATDNAKVILALTALGKDAANFEGRDWVSALTDTAFVANAYGPSGEIYALLALDSGHYLPGSAALREGFISAILEERTTAVDWESWGSQDTTGMALQALAPYYGSTNVKTAVDAALPSLAAAGLSSAEEISQALVALTALDPDSFDPAAYVTALLDYYDSAEGAFFYVYNGSIVNAMSTEQSSYALVAYARYVHSPQLASLYDMSDAKTTWVELAAATPPASGNPGNPGGGGGGGGATTDRATISVVDGSQTLLAAVSYTLNSGESALSLLKRTGLAVQTDATGDYLISIAGLAEFGHGPNSGWMYKVNGAFPTTAAARYRLQDGDVLEWVYTRDLGQDVGGGSATGGGSAPLNVPGAVIPALLNVNLSPEAIARDLAVVDRANPFTDVQAEDWFADAVKFVNTRGLMSGTAADQFSPYISLTRAMLVTILYRYEGEPAVTETDAFSDVESGLWYSPAIAWATENGIIAGYGDGRFGPHDPVTREQLAAILYRYAQYKGLDVSPLAVLNDYSDAPEISAYAREAMTWAVGSGLISGRPAAVTTENQVEAVTDQIILAPSAGALRAEAAVILQRFMED